jgi:hypothetical protein
MALAIGLVLANIVKTPIKDKLQTKITVTDKEKLKEIIDTLNVSSFEVNKESEHITISYYANNNFVKENKDIIGIIAMFCVIIIIVFCVRRFIRNRYQS